MAREAFKGDGLPDELEDLRTRLAEAEETLRAIRGGTVDALVVAGPDGDRVFTLEGADRSYRIFLEGMHEGAVTLAADGTILYCNRRFAEIVAVPLERIIGSSIDRFVREADRPVLQSVLREGIAGAGTGELILESGTGPVPVYLAASALPTDGVEAVCLVVTDLTEQKRNEQLVADERLARSILEHATEAIVVCNPEERILRASLAARKLCSGNPVGERFSGCFELRSTEPSGEPPVPFATVLAGRIVQGVEASLRLPTGESRQLLLSAGPLYASDEQITGCVLTLTDITDRRLAEMEVDRARQEAEAANQAKDHFLATLSHELRTPLTPVLAIVSGIKEDERLPADVRDRLTVMQRNVELEARLIDDMLDLTRISRGKLELRREVADLKQILDHALETSRARAGGKGLRFVVDLCPDDHRVWADASRLTQVFWNLLNNAVKFTPEGGTVAVRSRREKTPSPCLIVEISDTGIGIEPEALAYIFDAFNQGERGTAHRFGGLGLGLAISKAILELHGGSLKAASGGKDRGTLFTVCVPIGAIPWQEVPSREDAGEIRSPQPLAVPPLHILLVEDHPDTAAAMAELLRAVGHRVETAGSVAQALTIAETNDSGGFDLVLSDLGLPDGSGLELMRELSARYGWRGIALSGYGMEEDVRQSLAAGFQTHLTKPINVQALKAAIHQAWQQVR
ncbi:MAG TPA: ATP-binding protein [Thermoanaerobaculia bacterium]|nr:ATP-binding protein [Thermoanaerobaculia bacterium]